MWQEMWDKLWLLIDMKWACWEEMIKETDESRVKRNWEKGRPKKKWLEDIMEDSNGTM